MPDRTYPFKVVVTGGRDYADREYVFATLDELQPDFVAHGGARGADALAAAWCKERGVQDAAFHALWDCHGSAAGPIRNKAMLDAFAPNVVVAFPGGAGTANCVKEARRRGMEVRDA